MGKPLGFDVTTVEYADTRRSVARFRCSECSGIEDVLLKPGNSLNPEEIAHYARGRGWKATAFRKTRTYCPKCQGPARNDPDSELRKVTVMPTPLPPPPVSAQPVAIREATSDQRVKIRHYLDKSFDDDVGCYLDDMNDQRVAELVGVPRIIVERMREAAYGPIRVDPAALTLRNELAALKTAVESQQKGLDELKAKVAQVASRLEVMLAKSAA